MKQEINAQELSIYIGEDDQYRGAPVVSKVVEQLLNLGVDGVTVLKGVEGYGAHRKVHSAKVELLFEGLPLVIIAVDRPEKIDAALEALDNLLTEALVTVRDIRAIRYSVPAKVQTAVTS